MQSASGTVEAFRISVVVAGSNTVRDTNLCPSFPSQVNYSFKKSAFLKLTEFSKLSGEVKQTWDTQQNEQISYHLAG